MEHAGVTARNYESIKARTEEIGVPLTWGLGKRREYLTDRISESEAIISEAIKELAGSGELEHRLAMDRIEGADKNIRHVCFDLSRLKPNARKGKGVDDADIERAKEYPIESLLPNKVRRNMTLCPFHDDRSPSMSIKDNRAHCFSCNKTWDSIALIMELRGYEFIEAVKYLNEI